MTEDELDQIASAYLDGEATSEEVALVERDPDLQARVSELRSVRDLLSGSVTVPAGLMDQQLAGALAGLDPSSLQQPAPGRRGDGNVVVDFADRLRRRGSASFERERPTRSMPRWLPAAAALLLFGGGGIWLAAQVGGSDDAFDAAATMAEPDSTAAADMTEEQGAEGEASALAVEAAPAQAEEAAEAAEAAMDEATGGSDADGAAQKSGAGQSVDEPLLFDEIPDLDLLLPEIPPPLDPALARCNEAFDTPDGSTIVGFVPMEIAGAPAELFVLNDAQGRESALLIDVDSGCQDITP